ncbi:MAG: DUF1257 domain-containing protein [Planctomycetaceae bacterium]|nr:DUF1257 domain-containing protein [Planctomycetaceae bacterium]
MSHIVQIKTEVRDPVAVTAACRRLKLPEPVEETVQLFSGRATGVVIRLPGWRYPIVCDTNSGTVKFDNYEGRWGDRVHLDRLLQAYAVEKTRIEARRQGHTVTERNLADGSIGLTVQLSGGAA